MLMLSLVLARWTACSLVSSRTSAGRVRRPTGGKRAAVSNMSRASRVGWRTRVGAPIGPPKLAPAARKRLRSMLSHCMSYISTRLATAER